MIYEGTWSKNIFKGLGRLIDSRFDRMVVLDGTWTLQGTQFSGKITVDDIIVNQ
jgi:hypothetical protein